jgi:hypothetical protein
MLKYKDNNISKAGFVGTNMHKVRIADLALELLVGSRPADFKSTRFSSFRFRRGDDGQNSLWSETSFCHGGPGLNILKSSVYYATGIFRRCTKISTQKNSAEVGLASGTSLFRHRGIEKVSFRQGTTFPAGGL